MDIAGDDHQLGEYVDGATEGVGPRLCSCGDELMNNGTFKQPLWMHDSTAHFGLIIKETLHRD